MKEITDENIELLEHLAEEHDEGAARREIRDLHPADIAELLDQLNLRDAEWVFNLLDDKEKQAEVLMELDEEDRRKLLSGMDPEQIGHFIDLLGL